MLEPNPIHSMLLWTSLFILIPSYYAIPNNPPFACLLAAAYLASAANWWRFRPNSVRHNLDRAASLAVLTCVCAQSPAKTLMMPLLLTLFLKGRRAWVTRDFDTAARWHVLFRYCAFWVCLHHAQGRVSLSTLAVLSTLYWTLVFFFLCSEPTGHTYFLLVAGKL